jgi:hypothetical protein
MLKRLRGADVKIVKKLDARSDRYLIRYLPPESLVFARVLWPLLAERVSSRAAAL